MAIGYQNWRKVDRSNWIVQVAEYQQLYVRDTVQTSPALNADQRQALQLRLSNALGSPVNIPDFSAQDLRFMRGQVLSVNGAPLVQLVYLPENGKPIALCITTIGQTIKNQAKQNSLLSGTVRGMTEVHWQDDSSRFVLLGEYALENLIQYAMIARSKET